MEITHTPQAVGPNRRLGEPNFVQYGWGRFPYRKPGAFTLPIAAMDLRLKRNVSQIRRRLTP